MNRLTMKQKIEIYNNFLISLHTASWTGNKELIEKLMKKVAAYSYSRTNGHEKEEQIRMIQTLIDLGEE